MYQDKKPRGKVKLSKEQWKLINEALADYENADNRWGYMLRTAHREAIIEDETINYIGPVAREAAIHHHRKDLGIA